MVKKVLIAFGVIFVGALVLVLRPVPIVSEDEALVKKGVVSSIYEGGEKDVVIHLENSNRRFYINRGLEKGLKLNSLQEKLVGEKVTLKYPEYWTPLDWNNKIRHVSKVETENELIFNELKS